MAVAKAAIKSGVATKIIKDWEKYRIELSERIGSNQKTIRLIHDRSKEDPKKIIFAEADQLNVLKAAQIVLEEGIGIPILLGNEDNIVNLMNSINFHNKIEIIDPKCYTQNQKRKFYASIFWEEQKRNGITEYEANSRLRD